MTQTANMAQIADMAQAAQICRIMGWDYYTYQSQPLPFILALIEILIKENESGRTSSANNR